MPILVKDYTWTQSSETVNIRIPLDAVYREKVDLFTTDKYIKVHFNPFLFEIFLLNEVDSNKGKCIVDDDQVIIELYKKEEVEWDSLEKILTKDEKSKLRNEIILECQEKAKKESEERVIRKSNLDRFTVQKAMDIDSRQHELMDSRRDEERNKAMRNLETWRKDATSEKNCNIITNFTASVIDNTNIKKKSSRITELNEDYIEEKKPGAKLAEVGDNVLEKTTGDQKKITKPVKVPIRSEYVDKKKKETAKRVLPKLRETAQLEISHTPRSFPTPSRESTAREEEAWLKNITLARRATGFVTEDLRPEEQDPQWCKEKGDEFFRNGNFLGAISAYTHGITLSDKLPTLFANRAATHFALGNFNKCANDCSTALELMIPACEGNRRSRAKCIARRGAALTRLGYLSKGIDEMRAAVKLLPDDETIKKDLYDMERAWEQNPDSD